jgi:uncharacterized protein YraI
MRRKIFISLLGIVMLGVISSMAQAQQSTWFAQYYNSRYLIDPAVRTQQVGSVNFDWGGGSPADGINADGFSARFTKTTTLGAGTYQIDVRADDGVRVLIDTVPYVNDFFPGSGRQHHVVFTLMGGEHTIVIEYEENTGNAFINFEFSAFVAPTSAPTTTPIPGVTATAITRAALPTLDPNGAYLTVTTGRLNVRSLPTTNGNILTAIERYEQYPIVGRSISGDWYQIVVDNLRVVGIVVGWVSAEWVTVQNLNLVPVTYGFEGEPILTNYFLHATANVMLRTEPRVDSIAIGVVFATAPMQIAGITSDGNWWLVLLGGEGGYLGWVNHDFVSLDQDVDYSQIPIVDAFVADYPFD